MTNLLLSNSPDFYLDIDTNFIYNLYNENETQIDDSIIISNNNNFYKAIELKVKARTKYNKRVLKFYESISIADFKLLNNKNLNIDTLFYFNHVHKLDENLINLNYDTDTDSIQAINDYYNINNNKFELAKKFIEANKKISVNKNFEKEFLNLNYSNDFFTNSNNSNYNFYRNFLDKTIIDFGKDIKEVVLNKNFNVYRKKSVYQSNNDFTPYYINIGFLIEKYVKNQNDYKKSTSYFKYNMQNETIPRLSRGLKDHTIDYSFTIKDNAVKYGSTYKYVVYPVFVTSLPSRLDYHTLDEFIVCDFPYITKDIECKETIRPIPPSQIYFKYIKSQDNVKLEWSIPLEEQGDVKGYQIFKRHSLEDPFVLIRQLEFKKFFHVSRVFKSLLLFSVEGERKT